MPGLADTVERVLGFELSIVELLSIALLLEVPYLAIGIVWASTHSGHFDQLQGVQLAISLLGTIALWPALGLAHLCPT